MQTTEKLSHLKAMGIEVWRDRSAQALAPLGFHYLHLPAPKPILILADQDSASIGEEQTLLQAIAKALGFEASVLEGFSNQLDLLVSGQELIVMGENIAEALSGKKFIHTHAPSQLLKNPKLKSETWQAIRHLKV
jgi:DNA polymerase III psi subunit